MDIRISEIQCNRRTDWLTCSWMHPYRWTSLLATSCITMSPVRTISMRWRSCRRTMFGLKSVRRCHQKTPNLLWWACWSSVLELRFVTWNCKGRVRLNYTASANIIHGSSWSPTGQAPKSPVLEELFPSLVSWNWRCGFSSSLKKVD